MLQASVGGGEGAAASAEKADPKVQASTVAEDAWGRLKFFHGHGFSMVLASFVAFLLIANSRRLSHKSKKVMTWVGLVSMTLYNVGWFFAGALVGFVSLDDAKKIGEFGFFIPFGVTTVILWLIVLVAWIREVTSGEDLDAQPGNERALPVS